MSLAMRISQSGSGSLRSFAWKRAATAWADETGVIVRDALKNAAPVGQGPDAGRLRDSIRYLRRTGEGSVVLEFTAHTPYASYVIDGTRPHIIRARAARYLHWVDAGGGDRFAKQVNHPGAEPNRFPERTIGPLLPGIQRRYTQIVTDSLRR